MHAYCALWSWEISTKFIPTHSSGTTFHTDGISKDIHAHNTKKFINTELETAVMLREQKEPQMLLALGGAVLAGEPASGSCI